MSRRRFLKTAILTGFTVLVPGIPLATYTVFPSLKKKAGIWIDFGPVESLAHDGFNMLSYEFMVKDGWVALPQSGFIWAKKQRRQKVEIFSSTCSHLACNVIWQEETQQFICPCHSGRFDAKGNPVAGPPSKPLSRLANKIEDENLLVFMEV